MARAWAWAFWKATLESFEEQVKSAGYVAGDECIEHHNNIESNFYQAFPDARCDDSSSKGESDSDSETDEAMDAIPAAGAAASTLSVAQSPLRLTLKYKGKVIAKSTSSASIAVPAEPSVMATALMSPPAFGSSAIARGVSVEIPKSGAGGGSSLAAASTRAFEPAEFASTNSDGSMDESYNLPC